MAVTTPETPPTVTPTSDWKEYEIDNTKSIEENAAAKLEHDKTKPAEKPAEAQPLTRESVKLPEGFESDEPAMGKFIDVLNDTKLTPAARAQALIDLQAEVMRGASERASQAYTDMQEQWRNAVQTDKDIGGEKLQPALGRISQLIDTYPNAVALREALDSTGAGNNPEVIKFLHQIAGRLAEGSPAPAVSSPPKGSVAERMFPSMKG